MVKYIKDIVGLKFYKKNKLNEHYINVKFCCHKGEKYKEWNYWVMIFFWYYRTKLAEEDLWVYKFADCPENYQFYTKDDLKRKFHYLVDENNNIYNMSEVHIKLSDGSIEYYYFETDEEANDYIEKLLNKFKLVEWDND